MSRVAAEDSLQRQALMSERGHPHGSRARKTLRRKLRCGPSPGASIVPPRERAHQGHETAAAPPGCKRDRGAGGHESGE